MIPAMCRSMSPLPIPVGSTRFKMAVSGWFQMAMVCGKMQHSGNWPENNSPGHWPSQVSNGYGPRHYAISNGH